MIPRSTVSHSQPVSHLSADVLNSLHSHNSKLTNEQSLSCCRASLQIDRLKVLRSRSIMACKFISKLVRSQPPSASPDSIDHVLKVHLQPRSITASMLARSRPPIASPISLDHGLKVHLKTRSIMAPRGITKLGRSRPQSACLNCLDHGLKVHR